MDYDRILIHLGEFGTWQRRNYFLLWLPTLAAGINIMTAAWSVMTPRKGKSSAKCFPMIRKGNTQIKLGVSCFSLMSRQRNRLDT